MNETLKHGSLAVVAALLVVAGYALLVGGNQPVVQAPELGSGTRFTNGISTDSTSPSSGEVRTTTLTTTGAATVGGDATVSGGTLNVTTSNSATSTVVAGCFQFYATSTETPHKFQASTTPGVMHSQYGSCPNG